MTQSDVSDEASAFITGNVPPIYPLFIDLRLGKVTCNLQSYTSALKLVEDAVQLPTAIYIVFVADWMAADVSITKLPLVLVLTAFESTLIE